MTKTLNHLYFCYLLKTFVWVLGCLLKFEQYRNMMYE